jgi:hypothetical protein
MARVRKEEIEQLRAEISLERLAVSCGVVLEKRGPDLVGQCPFHDDGGRSLRVTRETNLWRCEADCGTGGDVIAWVMKREGVSLKHAVELLRGGYEPSAPRKRFERETAASPKLQPLPTPAEDAALLEEVVGYYTATLKSAPDALAYLEKRGLTDGELIEEFRLGFSDRTLPYRLPKAGLKAGIEIRERLQRLGVLRRTGHEHMRGSVVVPLLDAHGRIVNLYGRKIRDDLRYGTSSHLYLPGPHRGLFNAKALKCSDEVILTGSLMDALTFWSAGYRNVTSAYGPGGFTEELEAALVGHRLKRVLIAFGRDTPGDKGAEVVAERLAKRGVAAYRVVFPKGLDANAYALTTAAAPRALGALLRACEWMAGIERGPSTNPASELPIGTGEVSETAPVPPPETARSSLSDKDTAGSEAEPPEPSYAGPIPKPPPPEVPVEVSRSDVTIKLGDRVWRARGLERNRSLESLKVNLMVRRGDAFHVDGLDLLNAKSRAGYVAEAALELGLPVEAVKRDLGRVLLKLEMVQDERLEAEREAAMTTAPGMTPEEETAALAWLRAPGLLDRIAEDIASLGVVGERANALAVYLASLSRKLDKPLAVLIQSTSAAGKSALMDAVLDLVPEEERVVYSAMTGQSLFYLGEADLKHKALAIAEEEGARHAAYALKLLQSQGALTIASTGKDPASGKLVTQSYTVEGPVALMLTTTAIDLDEELKNRCLVLTIDESREQTRAIHARQRFEETLDGLTAGTSAARIVSLHRNAQRLLKPLKVVNPYADQLTFLDDKTRTRRDHRKYLALIRSIALLHQHQRPIRTLERPGLEPIAYIEATLEDIVAANGLAHVILGTTLDELPPQTRRLLGLIREWVNDRAAATGLEPREAWFSRRELREATGWGDTQVRLHLWRLVGLEYLFARRDGPRIVYELAWAGEGQDGSAFLMGLVDVEKLRAGTTGPEYDDEVAGVSRAGHGSIAAPSRDLENPENISPDTGLPSLTVEDAENACLRLDRAASVVVTDPQGE